MANKLTFDWVSSFIDAKYPGEVCRPDSSLMAIAKVLISAALLDACSPSILARFTGYDIGFIVAVLWNLREDQRCKEGRYDFRKWLTPRGEVNEDEFWDDIDIAAGYTLSGKTIGDPERIDAEKIYWSLHPGTEYDFR